MYPETERDRLTTCVRTAVEAARREARHLFWRVSEAPDGWRLECSDAAVLERLIGAVSAGCPEIAVQGALLPDPTLLRTRAWVLASVADVHKSPSHQSEQITQALQGELLEVLVHDEGWLLVRFDDGYLGWLRDWHVRLDASGMAEDFGRRANARITWSLVSLREAPEGRPCGEGLLGTKVVRRDLQRGWCQIELPGGRMGWVPQASLRDGTAPWKRSVSSILDMLQAFRGVPYVWGGKSPKGFDCSGLVQFVYALHGVPLPRDSDQQFQVGEAVDSPAPGDLLFFGGERITHVGVSLGGGEFLHARGEVRCNGLEPGSPLYARDLATLFQGARRVLTRDP